MITLILDLISILVAPDIRVANNTYIVIELSPITFQCTVTGIPSPHITWYKNGTIQFPSNDNRIILTTSRQQLVSFGLYQVTQSLTINATTDNDSGNYSCVGTNTVASVSATFELIVQGT